jgi:hypothetical protein
MRAHVQLPESIALHSSCSGSQSGRLPMRRGGDQTLTPGTSQPSTTLAPLSLQCTSTARERTAVVEEGT